MAQKDSSVARKFKNQFTVDPKFHQRLAKNDNIDGILSDRMGDVIKQKMEVLLIVFTRNAFENGFNFDIAYRIIMLYLYSEVQITNFNVHEQVNRYIEKAVQSNQLSNIQKAMDILLMKQLALKVPDRHLKLWRLHLLQALKRYYKLMHLKKQKSKVVRAIRSICVVTLQKDDVRKDTQTYTKILDILIFEERHQMQSFMRRGKNFQAIEFGNNIVRVLEKAQQSIIPKYQQQLMSAYWDIAQLHHRLHYSTYAKKYAHIALNIAERINSKRNIQLMRAMIEQLNL